MLRLGPCQRDQDHLSVSAAAAGVLRLIRRSSCWTIDLSRQRFCRTDVAIHLRFLEACHWTPISQIWLAAETGEASSSLSWG